MARDTNRGHTVTAVCNSFEQSKDCGFKVVTHMMPDLPNMGYERDILGFKSLFRGNCTVENSSKTRRFVRTG